MGEHDSEGDTEAETRKQLAILSRRKGARTSQWTRDRPTEWQPTDVIDPASGLPFTDAGAWEFVADQIASEERGRHRVTPPPFDVSLGTALELVLTRALSSDQAVPVSQINPPKQAIRSGFVAGGEADKRLDVFGDKLGTVVSDRRLCSTGRAYRLEWSWFICYFIGIRRRYFSRRGNPLSYCHHGITTCRTTLPTYGGVAVLLTLFLQIASAVAEVPSATQAGRSEGVVRGELDFTSPDAGISREGYVAIEWSEHPGGHEYRLVDGEGMELYRGPFPKAFVSGLPDGEHAFHAAALDEAGEPLARTSEPYRVTVEHWPLRQAWLLFSIGLVVFLALIVVLVRGAVGAGEAALKSKQLSSDRSPEAKE